MLSASEKTARLQELIHRKDKVLAVLHPPSATHARIMERHGCEVGFVGTSAVVGSYTGLADVGTMSLTECLLVSRWIAESVNFPVIMDGDTGHGGIMVVRRMVAECIKAGIAGVRIDDQPIEGKRRTQSAGIEVVPLEQAIARYRAAVDMKNELDPNFVIMAQCYGRDAAGSTLEGTLERLAAYETEAKVDWVQLASPNSIEDVKRARALLKGPFSFIRGKLPDWLSEKQHLELGVNIAWYPSFTHTVMQVALDDFMRAFREKGMEAWKDFLKSREGKPDFERPDVPPEGEGLDKQRELEERYLGAGALKKYEGHASMALNKFF